MTDPQSSVLTQEQRALVEEWAADTATQAGRLFDALLAAYDAQSRLIAELEAAIKQSDAMTQEYLAADARVSELQRALEEAKEWHEPYEAELQAKLTAALARAEAAEKDAARYRWICRHANAGQTLTKLLPEYRSELVAGLAAAIEIDRAIDAALATAQPSGGSDG